VTLVSVVLKGFRNAESALQHDFWRFSQNQVFFRFITTNEYSTMGELMKPVRCLAVCFAFACSIPAFSQTDAKGCKDSPIITRFPGSVITDCSEKDDDVFDFSVDSKPAKHFEGHIVRIFYNFPKTASKAEVVRNMNTALHKAGYTFDYDSGAGGDFGGHMGKTRIQIEISGGGNYVETIGTEVELKQLVTASAPPASLPEVAKPVAPEKPDAKGCKDASFIGRFPGSYITDCKHKADDTFEFDITNKPKQKMEGDLQSIYYNFPKTASKAQVVRNMNTAMRNAGYAFDYDTGDYGDFTVHMGNTWIEIQISGGGNYVENILTQTALKQEVVADAATLTSGLAKNGHMVVNGIYFDTAKADLKPESKVAIEQISKMLKADPKLKVYVVGHTDNVGNVPSNMDLSNRRAASVVQALTSQYGIAADRLKPYGDGPYAPIATNDTDDGRSLNRRVELVKQ
jgi:outer membrane protein OmpA-like peptidoglycan-associated protein